MSAKSRLDQALVDLGLATSRSAAQAVIIAGQVKVKGRVVAKPGTMIGDPSDLELVAPKRFVSRGGEKLASVARELKLNFEGLLVLDVGASAGGFSDYALQHGAAGVIAVDVGTGQLDWRLRQDSRVEVHEQTDIRNFQTQRLADLALVDVSFVSVLKIIEAVAKLVKPDGVMVVMVKPQFEAGKALADRFGGVISDEAVRQKILTNVSDQLSQQFPILGQADSKVLGPKGNRERFFVLKKPNR